MPIPKHYLTTPMVKMGQRALSPADSENWHGEHTSDYFKKDATKNFKDGQIIEVAADQGLVRVRR